MEHPISFSRSQSIEGYSKIEMFLEWDAGTVSRATSYFHDREGWLMFREFDHSTLHLRGGSDVDYETIDYAFAVMDRRAFDTVPWLANYCGVNWLNQPIGTIVSTLGRECNGVKMPDARKRTRYDLLVEGDQLHFRDSKGKIKRSYTRIKDSHRAA